MHHLLVAVLLSLVDGMNSIFSANCLPGDPTLTFYESGVGTFTPRCEKSGQDFLLGTFSYSNPNHLVSANVSFSCYDTTGNEVNMGFKQNINTLIEERKKYLITSENGFEMPEDINSGLTCYFLGCMKPPGGRTYHIDNSSCYIDYDECANDTFNDCHTNAECANLREGTYNCSCSRGYFGNGTECEAIVPVLEEISADLEVLNGSAVQLNCTGSSPEGNVSIAWDTSIPGATLPQPTQIQLDKGVVASFITLDSVSSRDTGMYTCTVSNMIESVSESTFMLVIIPPIILVLEVPEEVQSGESETLRCVATGHPLPQITWLHNNAVLDPLLSDSNVTINEAEQEIESAVRLSSITEEQAGNYTCAVSIPEYNQSTSETLPVLVQTPHTSRVPSLTNMLMNINPKLLWSIVPGVAVAVFALILVIIIVATKALSVSKETRKERYHEALQGEYLDKDFASIKVDQDDFMIGVKHKPLQPDEHSIIQALYFDLETATTDPNSPSEEQISTKSLSANSLRLHDMAHSLGDHTISAVGSSGYESILPDSYDRSCVSDCNNSETVRLNESADDTCTTELEITDRLNGSADGTRANKSEIETLSNSLVGPEHQCSTSSGFAQRSSSLATFICIPQQVPPNSRSYIDLLQQPTLQSSQSDSGKSYTDLSKLALPRQQDDVSRSLDGVLQLNLRSELGESCIDLSQALPSSISDFYVGLPHEMQSSLQMPSSLKSMTARSYIDLPQQCHEIPSSSNPVTNSTLCISSQPMDSKAEKAKFVHTSDVTSEQYPSVLQSNSNHYIVQDSPSQDGYCVEAARGHYLSQDNFVEVDLADLPLHSDCQSSDSSLSVIHY